MTQINTGKIRTAKEKIAGYAEELDSSIAKMDSIINDLQAGEGWSDTSKKGAENFIEKINDSKTKLKAIQECLGNLPIVLQKILDASDININPNDAAGSVGGNV